MVFLVLIVQSDSAASLLWENEVKKKNAPAVKTTEKPEHMGISSPDLKLLHSRFWVTHLCYAAMEQFFYLHLVIFTRRWALNPPEYEDDSWSLLLSPDFNKNALQLNALPSIGSQALCVRCV